MNVKVQKIIKFARAYLGVPWVHQGRSKNGVDCVGFLLLAFKSVNVDIIEIKGYSRTPDGKKLKEIMDNQPNLIQVIKNDLMVGDILLLKIKRDPQHVALIVDSDTADFGMIHSYNGGEKKVIEHDLADYWKRKIVSVYRLAE